MHERDTLSFIDWNSELVSCVSGFLLLTANGDSPLAAGVGAGVLKQDVLHSIAVVITSKF